MTNFKAKSAIGAGLIAGLVFLILEMALVSIVAGESPWGPLRMIAAIALGEAVLPPPATFDGGIVAVAMVVHFTLSAVYGLIAGWMLSRTGAGAGSGLLAGTLFGLALYGINFYGFTAVFPWFAMARNGISIFAHAVFGATAAAGYLTLSAPRAAEGRVGIPRTAH